MKKCNYCGFENTDSARSCGECASSLDEATAPPPPVGSASQTMRMVTVRKYMNLSQAELDKSVLEAAGIPVFLGGENSVASGYGGVLSELRLQVPEAEADRAHRMLDEHEGFAPLPDDFVPPVDPDSAGTKLETMERTTDSTESGNKNLVVSVVVTLLVVAVALVLYHPPGTVSSGTSERARQAYEDRARRSEVLLADEERQHQRYVDYLAKAEEDQKRFEKILATWEQQQQEYQKYLDGLPKKP